jgi:hypothetical protein
MIRLRIKKQRYFQFLIVLFAFLLFVITWIVRGINSSRWDGNGRYTVVLNSKPIGIFSIEPQKRKVVFTQIREEAMVDVPYGYSTYPASSIFKLGELDGKRGGGKLLSKSMEYTMGIAVNGFFSIGNDRFPLEINSQTDIEKVKDKYFTLSGGLTILTSLIFNKTNYKSDIPLVDIWKVWTAIKKTRSDQIYYLNLDNKNIYDEDKLPDGTVVSLIDKNRLDAALADYFEDSKIRNENVTIEIVNATNKERLASQFTRILTKIGANVLVKSNNPEIRQKACIIEISDIKLKDIIIIKRLKEMYSCQLIDKLIDKGQAEIKITIGEDFNK